MNSFSARFTRNPWPHAILAWFVIFAAALAAWMVFAVRQKSDLVRPDYYEEEVHYQGQLDRLNRTAAIRGEVAVHYDASRSEVTLVLPGAHRTPRPAGQIQFYRPSNASLDFQLPLSVDAAGLQRIGTGAVPGGLWKVRVHWSVAGQDYFFEQVIVLDEAGPGLRVAPPMAK